MFINNITDLHLYEAQFFMLHILSYSIRVTYQVKCYLPYRLRNNNATLLVLPL